MKILRFTIKINLFSFIRYVCSSLICTNGIAQEGINITERKSTCHHHLRTAQTCTIKFPNSALILYGLLSNSALPFLEKVIFCRHFYISHKKNKDRPSPTGWSHLSSGLPLLLQLTWRLTRQSTCPSLRIKFLNPLKNLPTELLLS
jgi:hypothetical protein